MDATENRSANQAVEFEFDEEITLKVRPIKDGIAQPVLLGSPRIGMFRYIGERQDGLMLANRLERSDFEVNTLPLEIPRQRERIARTMMLLRT